MVKQLLKMEYSYHPIPAFPRRIIPLWEGVRKPAILLFYSLYFINLMNFTNLINLTTPSRPSPGGRRKNTDNSAFLFSLLYKLDELYELDKLEGKGKYVRWTPPKKPGR